MTSPAANTTRDRRWQPSAKTTIGQPRRQQRYVAFVARPKTDTRERLLDAAVAYVADNGIGDISLRQLADALGTSHRMLIFHFGSKEGLLVEVVRAVEAQQRALVADMAAQGTRDPRRQLADLWRRLTDPAAAPQERLFFELYGQ